MNREDFLERCGTIYDMGLATPVRLKLLDRWADFVLRFDGVYFGHNGQGRMLMDFMETEQRRIINGNGQTLASDADGYALVQMAAILVHPCQQCAVNPKAWHTRGLTFCQHKEESVEA